MLTLNFDSVSSKSTQKQAARVIRACNSVNLKPRGIIEPLLKIVNVLRMRPRLGVVHSDQPGRHGYGGIRSVGAFITFGEVSKKVLCT